ncbi:right-handed parallel beta-helix repeat-containing protein [Verrucomicrobium spinosum]|uniref:right-handed parallel beta-helix repeat-containing protein n=1 Tax=Verrucomicrobium spinosum TaxID=2736 RepID=UPI00210DA1A3|nr:right-handed parallel beta-helix repeat-containing protein [Verrucomicrobium spinosum]
MNGPLWLMPHTCIACPLAQLLIILLALSGTRGAEPNDPPFSIQAALDASPGTMVHVPAGDHLISAPLRLHHDHSGLYGEGRIIQQNPEVPILIIQDSRDVTVRGLTLTRAKDNEITRAEGVVAIKCRDLVLDGIRVINNRTRSAAIAIRESQGTDIRDCRVRNYMCLTIDDRTNSPDWGYAFNCIDGTGIAVSYSQGTSITGCRVVEEDLLPTREIQQKHGLGKFVKKNPQKGTIVSQKTWGEEFVSNWHQGSAIIVTAPESSDLTRILNNHIENAAQGVDLHSDHVILSGNVINNSFMGMKAMHGSRNVIITGNQFIKNDLWSIGLMPGASSHGAAPAAEASRPLHQRGWGSIIANNIISDFGRGHSAWVWEGQGTPIRFDNRQKPHNPPLADVVIQGNVIYDSDRDEAAVAGTEGQAKPKYEYAVRIATEAQGLHFSGNLFHPGRSGVSNIPLPP